MSWRTDALRNSRIATAIGQIERGEVVDWKKLDTLQALDLVQAGRLFVADAIDAQESDDERAQVAARGL